MTSEAKRVLVLQGGGALGSYQAGVFEALAAQGLEPEWVAGISIGAINAALIAGNPPEKRIEALREFWRIASSGPQLDWGPLFQPLRAAQNQLNSGAVATFGVAGFFTPRFPPIEIDGEHYWDGGLVSNTPLDYVAESERETDLLVFQVDLFPAVGPMPRNLIEATEREMDIRYSSRTRMNTDMALRVRHARRLVRRLLAQLPEELQQGPVAAELAKLSQENALTVVHLIYRRAAYESSAKDYEFSRATMLEHWAAGMEAVKRSMKDKALILTTPSPGGARVFDIRSGGAEQIKEA